MSSKVGERRCGVEWRGRGDLAGAGEAVVHFCIRILTLQGLVCCLAPRDGNQAYFILVAEWLGKPIPAIDPEPARAELLRRYEARHPWMSRSTPTDGRSPTRACAESC